MSAIETSFLKHLHAAVMSCALPEELLQEQDPVTLLEKIHRLCEDPVQGMAVRFYSEAMIAFLRKSVGEKPMRLNAIASALLTYRALLAVSHRYSKRKAPLIQHWLPRSYIRRWVRSEQGSGSKKTLHLQGIVHKADHGFRNTSRVDSRFTHKPVGRVGFYEPELEYFFSLLETDFGTTSSEQWVVQQKEPWCSAVSFVFIAAQLARTPSPDQPLENTLAPILRSMLKSMAYFDDPEGMLLDVEKRQIFTAKGTPRITRTKHGDVFIFPVAPKRVAAIYGGTTPHTELLRAAEMARAAQVAEARRTREPLFGVNLSQL